MFLDGDVIKYKNANKADELVRNIEQKRIEQHKEKQTISPHMDDEQEIWDKINPIGKNN